MATNLEHLARRLEDDPFFLACPLTLYATSEGLSEESLALIGDNYLSPLATIRNPHRLTIKTTKTLHRWGLRERTEPERSEWPRSGRDQSLPSPRQLTNSSPVR